MRELVIARLLAYIARTSWPEILGNISWERGELLRPLIESSLEEPDRMARFEALLRSWTDEELVDAFDSMCCHLYR